MPKLTLAQQNDRRQRILVAAETCFARTGFHATTMQAICLVIPVQPGSADDARAFMRELETSRKDAYAASERRIGITRETWHLAVIRAGDMLVAHIETESFTATLGSFAASRDEFDVWFKRRLADSTGLDLNDPPDVALPELLSSYAA